MTTVGNIAIPTETTVPERTYNIEWKIANFSSLSSEIDRCYFSPPFAFAGDSWNLMIYPNGDRENIGYISLYLKKTSSSRPVKLEFSLGLKDTNNKKFLEHYRTYEFKEKNQGVGVCQVILRSDFLEKNVFLPTGPLNVFCCIKYPEAEKCAIDDSLCQDYKKALLEGSHHDLILKVSDKEFRAHRDILKARSTVFWSMLNLDMKEKYSDSVDIPDCSPDAMEQFLLYIYSGKIETLDQSNMLGLYYIADKYDVKGLKEQCKDFIKNSLTLTNICEVIQLAMSHCDSILLEKATEYFGTNMLGIMRTVEWQDFMRDNSTVANELLIKSVEKLNNVKQPKHE